MALISYKQHTPAKWSTIEQRYNDFKTALRDSEKTFIALAYQGGHRHKQKISGMNSKSLYVPRKRLKGGLRGMF